MWQDGWEDDEEDNDFTRQLRSELSATQPATGPGAAPAGTAPAAMESCAGRYAMPSRRPGAARGVVSGACPSGGGRAPDQVHT